MERKLSGRNLPPGGQIDPTLGHRARAKNGRAGIVAAQCQLQIVGAAIALAARDDDDIGAHQGGERLAQAPEREYFAAAERSERVNQHDVRLALEADMLKAVIEDQDVDAKALLENSPGVKAVRANAHRRHAPAQENLRLVARLGNLHTLSWLEDEMPGERLPAVAAAQDAGPAARPPHLFGQIEHERRLSGAAHRHVADADDAGAQFPAPPHIARTQ